MNQQSSSHEDGDVRLALDNCAREPVHRPGRIQSFGCLLGIAVEDLRVIYESDNAVSMLGLESPAIGHDFGELFAERELTHEIRNAIGVPTIRTQRERLGSFSLAGRPVDAAVHMAGETIVLELERDDYPKERPGTSVTQVRSLLGWITAQGESADPLKSATTILRRLTGFDRVMGYRFISNGDGEVAAEAHRPGVDPFLGLRYPASDIPQPVREAMLKMPFRCIADIEAESPMLLTDGDRPPLDLTLTHMKGVSPIHVEYLRNMGVRSTMNVPIICRGELWGLFAFHHYRAKLLSPRLRSICELFGHFFSLEIQQDAERRSVSKRLRVASLQRSIKESGHDRETLCDLMKRIATDLLRLFDADGMTVVGESSSHCFGNALSAADTAKLIQASDEEIFIIENLSDVGLDLTTSMSEETDESSPNVAGVLAIQLRSDHSTAVVFFRDEIVSKVRWAGHPEKRIEFGPNGPRLHPRASFDEYIESVHGRCRPWATGEMAAARELRGSLLDLVYQDAKISGEQWKRQKEYQDLLIAELNHRVKNVLALVRSIARQSQSGASSLQSYTEAFEARIAALATAHDLIGGSGLQWAPLRSILSTEVRPFENKANRIHLSGPAVSLKSDVAPVMALVVHELITNAAKYGPLSTDQGELSVTWRHRDGGIEIVWQEKSEVKVDPPQSSGFGLSLIRRAIPHECGGEAAVEFRSEGLRAVFWLPNEHIQLTGEAPSDPVVTATQKDAPALNLCCALVVDDNMILSMELEAAMSELGCEQVHAAGNVEEAMALINQNDYDVAILDVNLGGTSSFAIATALIERQTPVVFVSGYGAGYPVPQDLKSVPRLSKPVRVEELHAVVRELVTN